MDILNIANSIIVMIGLPVLLRAAMYLGKRLQKLDDLQATVNSLEASFANMGNGMNQMRDDTREIRIEVSEVKSKVNILWDWFTKYIINEKRAV